MSRKSLLASAATAAALAVVVGTPARGHDDDHQRGLRRFKAALSGFQEYPSTLSTTGRGAFHAALSKDGNEVRYWLQYDGLEGGVVMAHIHLGDRHTSGGISVWLCGTMVNPGPAGTPTCGPGGDGPQAEGSFTAGQVVGPSAQGLAPGEFEELVRALRAGVTYVNVHTTKYPGGEIRGQIRGE